MPPARPPTSGFDITPAPPLAPRPPNAAAAARRTRPAGLSNHDKALLGLCLVAFLGAAALVADALSVRDGYTPAKGFREVDRQADHSDDAGGANGASAAVPDGSGAGAGLANLTGATSTGPVPAAASAGSPTSASSPSSGVTVPTPPPVTTSSSSSSASVATPSSSTSSSAASTTSPSSSSSSTTGSSLPTLPCIPLPPLVTC